MPFPQKTLLTPQIPQSSQKSSTVWKQMILFTSTKGLDISQRDRFNDTVIMIKHTAGFMQMIINGKNHKIWNGVWNINKL